MFGFTPDSGAPYCGLGVLKNVLEDTVDQDLTLVGTGSYIYATSANLSHVMEISHSLLENVVYNVACTSNLNLVQVNIVNQTFNVTISHTLILDDKVRNILELSISHALNLVLSERLICFSQLNLTQAVQVVIARHVTVQHELELLQQGFLNYVQNLEICHCLELTHKARQQIAISVTQSLVLQLFEIFNIVHVLDLIQTFTDNFNDGNACCNIAASTKDRSISDRLIVGHSVGVGMVYNVRIEHALNISQTVAWRE